MYRSKFLCINIFFTVFIDERRSCYGAFKRTAAVHDDTDADGVRERFADLLLDDAVELHEAVHDFRWIEVRQELRQRFLAEAAHDDALLPLLDALGRERMACG